MPGIEIKGRSKIANYRHGGRAGHAHGMSAVKQAIKGITERLGGGEEGKPHSTRAGRRAAGVRRIKRFTDKKRGLGRADISSIRKGLKSKAGAFKTHGRDVPKIAARKFRKKKVYPETEDLTHQKGPYVGDVGSERSWPKRKEWKKPIGKFPPEKGRKMKKPIGQFPPEEGRKMQPLKKGGKTDKKWIQKAVDPKHKGYCTPMTKKTCTPARKALARTFKKKAKTGWG